MVKTSKKSHLIFQIVTATFFRLATNTARRFIYPFAPLMSRNLDVSLTAVTSMIALTQTTSLLGIAAGPMADRWGSRAVMRMGMALLAIGMLICALSSIYTAMLIGLIFAGLAKTVYDPAVQAYVGHRVSFERRGLAIGSIETAWAGSTLIGIPTMALIIDRFGLQWSFFGMALIGATGFFVLARVIPDDGPAQTSHGGQPGLLAIFKQLIRMRPAAGMLGFAFWMSMSNDNLFVVFGAWLEKDFGVSLIALGLSSGVIGAAELMGESIVALWSDKIGLKRSLIIGLIMTAICYALLPIIGTSLPTALAGLFLLFMTFEFTIVCSFSLSTELLPTARATMMAGVLAAAGLGRMAGAITGGSLWLASGLWGVSLVSVLAALLALGSLLWGLRGMPNKSPIVRRDSTGAS